MRTAQALNSAVPDFGSYGIDRQEIRRDLVVVSETS